MNKQNNCTKYFEDIAAFVLGLLEPKDAEILQKHLDTCQDCKALYQNMLNEEKDIRSSFSEFAQKGEDIQNSLIEKLDNLETIEKRKVFKLNRSKLIRNPLIKFAAAAAIIIFVLFMGQSEDNTLWAKMSEALERVNSVHVSECYTDSNNEKIIVSQQWIKRPNLFRNENSRELKIDNGIQELTLNKEQKTAQTLDSQQINYPIVKYMFAFIGMLNEPTSYSDFEKEVPILTKVPEECTNKILVYDAHYKPKPNIKRIPMKFRIWVDAKKNLFTHFLALPGEDNPGLTKPIEYFFDYEEIPNEIFALNIPDEYTIVDPPQQTVFSGTVLGQDNQPVSGAEVYITGGSRTFTGKTDYNGNFKIMHQTSLGGRLEFPVFVRAFRKDITNEVAWTIIHDPENNSTLVLNPPNPGDIEISIDNDPSFSGNCTGVKGILLHMQPALQITGKVTDKNNNGLTGAEVILKKLRLTKQNDFPSGDTYIKASCTTDSQGNYVLGSLPNLPKDFSIELVASKDNYIKSDGIEMLRGDTLEQIGPDFELLNGGVTIKGFVKNSDGKPLPGYGIWHTVNGQQIGQVQSIHGDGGEGTYVFTGKNGEFELINCPAMEGLAITATGSGKSPSWDFRMKYWKLEREFEYYDEKTVDIGYEPEKNEYTVEIILEKADTTVEFEVKDAQGQPIANAEVSFGTSPFNYQDDFKTTTDETGKCILNNLPWTKQPRLSVRNQEEWKYVPIVWQKTELSENVKHYKIEVTLGNPQTPLDQQIVVKSVSD